MKYSILDASNDFVGLSNSIGKFKKELCSKKAIDFGSQDTRIVILDTLQQYLLSLTAYIRAFCELQKRCVTTEDFLRILNLGITRDQLDKIIYKFPIESLVTMIHFQIDSYLGEISNQAKFYARVKDLFNPTVASEECYKNNLLCLSFFRNSFHGKGIHRKYPRKVQPPITKGEIDRIFECGGCKIEFKHDDPIEYNWKSVYLLIQESIEALKFLLRKT